MVSSVQGWPCFVWGQDELCPAPCTLPGLCRSGSKRPWTFPGQCRGELRPLPGLWKFRRSSDKPVTP